MVRSFEAGTRALTIGTRAFQQTLSTATIVDDYEDQNLDEYSFSAANSYAIETGSPISDTASLRRDGSADTGYEFAVSTSGLDNYVSKGSTFQAKMRYPVDSSSSGASQGGLLFAGADTDNWYGGRYDAVDDDLNVVKHTSSGGQSTIATTNTVTGGSYTAGDVVILEVVWDDGTLGGSDNDITVTLYNSDKTTEHGSASANDSAHATNTGVGAQGYADADANEWIMDDYEIL